MLLQDYGPRSKLGTKSTPIDKRKFSVVDAHNHLEGSFTQNWEQRPARELIDRLDEAGVIRYIALVECVLITGITGLAIGDQRSVIWNPDRRSLIVDRLL